MRNAIALALICAAAGLGGCHKEQQEQGLVNWQAAPPLLAGVDEGEGTGDAAGVQTAGQTPGGGAQGRGGGRSLADTPAAKPGTVPVRKAGLWAVTTDNGQGQGPRTNQLCVTDESELRRGVLAGGGGRGRGPGCEPKIAKSGAAWTSTMSCTVTFGENTVKMSQSETLTGDLTKSYKITGTATGGGRDGGATPRKINTSGVYKGACPADMKAGDMITADGQRRNVFEGGGGPGGGNRGDGAAGGPGGGQRRGPGGGAPAQ